MQPDSLSCACPHHSSLYLTPILPNRSQAVISRLRENALLTDDPELRMIIHLPTLWQRATALKGERTPKSLLQQIKWEMALLGYQGSRPHRPTPARRIPDYVNRDGQAIMYPDVRSSALERHRQLAKLLASDEETHWRLRAIAEGLPDPKAFPPAVLASKTTHFLRCQMVIKPDELGIFAPLDCDSDTWAALIKHLWGITGSAFKPGRPEHFQVLRHAHHVAWLKIGLWLDRIPQRIHEVVAAQSVGSLQGMR